MEHQKQNPLDKKPQHTKSANFYMKYMGLAFQLGATIGVGAFIGYQLDQWANFEKDYFTVLFVMLFAGAGLYTALKDLI